MKVNKQFSKNKQSNYTIYQRKNDYHG